MKPTGSFAAAYKENSIFTPETDDESQVTCAQRPKARKRTSNNKRVNTIASIPPHINENSFSIPETDEDSEIKCGQEPVLSGFIRGELSDHVCNSQFSFANTPSCTRTPENVDAANNNTEYAACGQFKYHSIYTNETESPVQPTPIGTFSQPMSLIPSVFRTQLSQKTDTNVSQFIPESIYQPNVSQKVNEGTTTPFSHERYHKRKRDTNHNTNHDSSMSLFDKLKYEQPMSQAQGQSTSKSGTSLKCEPEDDSKFESADIFAPYTPDLFSMKPVQTQKEDNVDLEGPELDQYDTLPHANSVDEKKINSKTTQKRRNTKSDTQTAIAQKTEATISGQHVASTAVKISKKRKFLSPNDLNVTQCEAAQTEPRPSKMRACRNRMVPNAYKEIENSQVDLTDTSIFYKNKNDILDHQINDQINKNIQKINSHNNERPKQIAVPQRSQLLAGSVKADSEQVLKQLKKRKPIFLYRNAERAIENESSRPMNSVQSNGQDAGEQPVKSVKTEKVSDNGPYVDFGQLMKGYKRNDDFDASLVIRASYATGNMPLDDVEEDDDLIIVEDKSCATVLTEQVIPRLDT